MKKYKVVGVVVLSFLYAAAGNAAPMRIEAYNEAPLKAAPAVNGKGQGIPAKQAYRGIDTPGALEYCKVFGFEKEDFAKCEEPHLVRLHSLGIVCNPRHDRNDGKDTLACVDKYAKSFLESDKKRNERLN